MPCQIERTYKTYGETPVKSAPNPDAPQIDIIPGSTTVEVTECEKHWVKVKGRNGSEGWAASTLMERIMEPPGPDLEFYSNGYKIIDGKYRNFFGIKNFGTADFTDSLTLRLYSRNRPISEITYTFSSESISDSGGRNFFVDTDTEVDEFEFQSNGQASRSKTNGRIS